MLKLVYFVPFEGLEQTKAAAFAAGAGTQDHYSQVCWQTKGMGQFLPMTNANPSIGRCHQLTQIEEYRVEMLCSEDSIKTVINAIIKAHPYERPAIEFWRVTVID
ncbi:MAG: NGG1p interacting factor NIF3 [Pseudomonadota bacterium]